MGTTIVNNEQRDCDIKFNNTNLSVAEPVYHIEQVDKLEESFKQETTELINLIRCLHCDLLEHNHKVDNSLVDTAKYLEIMIQNLSSIQKTSEQELSLLKRNNELFENIFYKMVDTFQLQNKNMKQLDQIISIKDESTERQLKWIDRDIKDIKDYINLPWYKKLFLKLF